MLAYKRNPDLIFTDMHGEVVMMSMENGSYFGIGGVGTRVWELLENPMTIEGIVKTVVTEFSVDEGRCRVDIEAFIAQLEAHRMISRSGIDPD